MMDVYLRMQYGAIIGLSVMFVLVVGWIVYMWWYKNYGWK